MNSDEVKMIDQVFKNNTVSNLLILPIYSHLIKDIVPNISKQEIERNIKYNFMVLLYEKGFVNSYLFDENDTEGNTLKLVFKKDLVTSYIDDINTSIFDILIQSYCFNSFKYNDKHIFIYLDIPEKYKKDIDNIKNNLYSKVSLDYKKLLQVPEEKFISGKNYMVNFITIKNIPLRIVKKDEVLLDLISKNYDVDKNHVKNAEYFIKFSSEKETLHIIK